MVSGIVVIEAPNGMHARPAGELVKLVRTLESSKVTFKTSKKEVNAGSVLSVLSLGLKRGAELTVNVEGGNEEQALESVISFIRNIDK